MTFSAILVVMSKLNVGDLLDGRYRIETPIARGGMSTVYRCIDTRLGRPVAAKVMDDRYIDDRCVRGKRGHHRVDRAHHASRRAPHKRT